MKGRWRRRREDKIARAATIMGEFLESEENRQRWFTRADLEEHLKLHGLYLEPDDLKEAFGRVLASEHMLVDQRGPGGRTRYAWFRCTQLRMPLGMTETSSRPGILSGLRDRELTEGE